MDVRSRRQTWTSEEGHTETIFDCSLSPANPDDLFSCSFDGTIRRWDARMKKCVQTFYTADARARGLGGGDRAYEAGKGSLYSCAVSCDGSIVCGGGYEGKLYVFDVESGRAMPSLEENKLAIHRVVAHPSEPGVFAFACLDHTLTLVHVERHREGRRAPRRSSSVGSCTRPRCSAARLICSTRTRSRRGRSRGRFTCTARP